MRQVISVGLALLLWWLIYTGVGVQEYNKQVALAAEQAKQGARFTADDGRKVCEAILAIDAGVRELLPKVCFSEER